MIKVAITDDHPLVIQGLKDMLSDQKDMSVVGAYTNARDTEQQIGASDCEILLLDINLPDKDGTELCSLLHEDHPRLGIIGLSSYDELSMVRTMIRHGARGYLLKNVAKEELLTAIRTVHAGGEHIQEVLQKRLATEALGLKNDRSATLRLTRREKEVLSLIMDELTTQEIAKKLFLSPKTVESHRAVLFQKFGVRNVAGLVKQAIEHGHS